MKKTLALMLVGSGVILWLALMGSSQSSTGHGQSEGLQTAYDRWRAGYEAEGGSRRLILPLAYSRAYSSKPGSGMGRVTLDLVTGDLELKVAGLPADGAATLWFVENDGPKEKAASHREFRVGDVKMDHGIATLKTRLRPEDLEGFRLDMAVLTEQDGKPSEPALLYGSPSLFQRLYYGQRPWTIGTIALRDTPRDDLMLASLLPAPAIAAENAVDKEALIARGRELFFNETFNGNGRTCGTCHREDNNHTIDPAYIAKLPQSDPLFVAENNPGLAGLENSALLRRMGLIMANVDGFDRPGVLRGVPHTLALATSILSELPPTGEFPQDAQYANAVGWSGDGAPGDGSLRAFTQGAIKQHMTQSLNRTEGVDFRLATDDELDAIEAYLLSLGRQNDAPLAELRFSDPLVDNGRKLFDQKQNPVEGGRVVYGKSANCNGCHTNAGANSSTTLANPTRDNGMELMRDQPHHLIDASVPYDGGQGSELQQDCGPDRNADCYSDGSLDPHGVRPPEHQRLNRFNTPSLYEAADTAPFFHNNSVTTIEEAVGFYNTEVFNASPSALTSKKADRKVRIDSSQVTQVALFLRTLNAAENIRSADRLLEKALTARRSERQELGTLAAAEVQDAIEVLKGGAFGVYPEVVASLTLSLRRLKWLNMLVFDKPLKTALETNKKACLSLFDLDTEKRRQAAGFFCN